MGESVNWKALEDDIRRLRKDGLYPAQIAAALGTPVEKTRTAISRLGLRLTYAEMQTPEFKAYQAENIRGGIKNRKGRDGSVTQSVADLLNKGFSPHLIAMKLRKTRRLVLCLKYRAKKKGLLLPGVAERNWRRG